MSESAKFACPVCHVTIEPGQAVCGNCKTVIAWRNGQPHPSKAQMAAILGVAGIGGYSFSASRS
jgi:predicted nucleic acid-binding Zn ribbon protein